MRNLMIWLAMLSMTVAGCMMDTADPEEEVGTVVEELDWDTCSSKTEGLDGLNQAQSASLGAQDRNGLGTKGETSKSTMTERGQGVAVSEVSKPEPVPWREGTSSADDQ